MPSSVAIISHPDYALHLTGSGHPERPERIAAIIEALTEANLIVSEDILTPQPASDDLLRLCHTNEYLSLLKDEVSMLKETGVRDTCVRLSTGDAVICCDSLHCARLAVGGALLGVDTVLAEGPPSRVYCVARPPGHHATPGRGMGFCLLNAIAIAARYAQQKYGLSKIAIVDWDVHHGNGTQEIFEKDPSVLYASIHESPLYPFTGRKKEAGEGQGVGYTVNCPITAGPEARERVMHAFNHIILPALHAFQPQLILVSCGFDAHYLDPLGGLQLKDADYAALTQELVKLATTHCAGRLVSFLEGGYSLEALASASIAHVQALLLPQV